MVTLNTFEYKQPHGWIFSSENIVIFAKVVDSRHNIPHYLLPVTAAAVDFPSENFPRRSRLFTTDHVHTRYLYQVSDLFTVSTQIWCTI